MHCLMHGAPTQAQEVKSIPTKISEMRLLVFVQFIFNHFNFDDPISFRQFCHCKFSSHEQFETQYNTQQQQGCNLDASYWLKHVIV